MYKDTGKDKICYKNFSIIEKTKSSIWRELEAIRYSLEYKSTKHTFKFKTIFWYTDNYATSVIVKKGSNKTHLHNLAIDIFETCFADNLNLDIFWISRDSNKEADKLSKEIDYDDWYITFEVVNMVCQKWGKISLDRFASDKNNKCSRFNSKFLCPNSETVNAFSSD